MSKFKKITMINKWAIFILLFVFTSCKTSKISDIPYYNSVDAYNRAHPLNDRKPQTNDPNFNATLFGVNPNYIVNPNDIVEINFRKIVNNVESANIVNYIAQSASPFLHLFDNVSSVQIPFSHAFFTTPFVIKVCSVSACEIPINLLLGNGTNWSVLHNALSSLHVRAADGALYKIEATLHHKLDFQLFNGVKLQALEVYNENVWTPAAGTVNRPPYSSFSYTIQLHGESSIQLPVEKNITAIEDHDVDDSNTRLANNLLRSRLMWPPFDLSVMGVNGYLRLSDLTVEAERRISSLYFKNEQLDILFPSNLSMKFIPIDLNWTLSYRTGNRKIAFHKEIPFQTSSAIIETVKTCYKEKLLRKVKAHKNVYITVFDANKRESFKINIKDFTTDILPKPGDIVVLSFSKR